MCWNLNQLLNLLNLIVNGENQIYILEANYIMNNQNINEVVTEMNTKVRPIGGGSNGSNESPSNWKIY